MISRYGNKWTRDETILSLCFYYEVPYGRISRSNKYLQDMSAKMGRSLSSLIMKMVNLASMDETHLSRGVTSLPHVSKLDREIWLEFKGNYPQLVLERERIMSSMVIDTNSSIENTPCKDIAFSDNKYTLYERKVLSRNGQNFFRKAVLSAYGERCCATGIAIPELLQACHIKPWSKCESFSDCLNPANGLCFNYLLHRAFDLGYITVHSQTMQIIVSSQIKKHPRLDEVTNQWIVSLDHKNIEFPERNQPYSTFLEYHNDMIFNC